LPQSQGETLEHIQETSSRIICNHEKLEAVISGTGPATPLFATNPGETLEHIQETSSRIICNHEKLEAVISGTGPTALWYSHFQKSYSSHDKGGESLHDHRRLCQRENKHILLA
jgi:homoserine kinase